MATELTQETITSRELENLVEKVTDRNLREKIQTAMARLELHKTYGLKFERHIPEVITVDGKSIKLGDQYFPWLKKVEQVKGAETKGPEHILMESDNYIALKFLQYTHQESVDVIYIDPPYNTGAKDWKYNNDYVDSEDNFRHSKWLSFMEKRLKLARKLLKPDGVLICAIDHYELFPLGMLLEEIFQGWEVTQTVVVNNPAGRNSDPFATCHEYHLVVHRPQKKAKSAKKKESAKTGYHERPFRKADDISGNREQRPNMFYPIWVDPKSLKIIEIGEKLDFGQEANSKSGLATILPIDNNRKERRWRWNTAGLKTRLAENPNAIIAKKTKNGIQIYITEEVKKTEKPKTVWIGPEHNYATKGTSELNKLIPKTTFNFPKSIETVKYAVDRFLPKDGIALDFFAGSGTTFQAVAELNESDRGTRQCILVTNNESNICRDVTWERIKRVTTGTHDYPECTKKYDGCPQAHATFYAVEIHDEDGIDKITRGWKQNMEGYLPLLSTKLNLPHNWDKIPRTQGFHQKDSAIIQIQEIDYDFHKFLKENQIKTIAIISDDQEEFDQAKKRCMTKAPCVKKFLFLPRNYTNYFENFHQKES